MGSHSMWYQITSMLTEQAIDALTAPKKDPPWDATTRNRPTTITTTTANHSNTAALAKTVAKNWGRDKKEQVVGGRRVLLDRMLQQRPNYQQHQTGGVDSKTRMTVMQAVQALHKQADTNHDGRISDHEILDIFQGVRNHLGASNFGAFLDLVNKLKGPINCSKAHDCGKCTDVKTPACVVGSRSPNITTTIRSAGTKRRSRKARANSWIAPIVPSRTRTSTG